jgi:UDP-N-acetyl-D-mannosaminuronic acid dehydrogenase
LIRTARDVNDSKPEFVLNKLKQVAEEFKHPKIALLGLAFKADIDDLRESPAVGIAQKVIQEALGEVFIVEPHITELPAKLQADNVSLVSLAESLEKVNIIVTLTDHTVFKQVKPSVLQEKIIIDARGIWEQD